MTNSRVYISSEYLRQRMEDIKAHHEKLKSVGLISDDQPHGIVPDMINEILRLRGEPTIEFPWAHFPAFNLDK